ncbi:MAG TPA: histidine kinase, partial [Acidaminococcaceae bacterium]|nr:histidine kinase [Acidaminococcaceae bacterium]
LVQNSLEHGFEGCTQGTLAVDLFETPGNVILRVTDDGAGLPKDFQAGRSKSLGLKIVHTVVTSDLKGVFYLHNRTDGVRGTMAEVILPRV